VVIPALQVVAGEGERSASSNYGTVFNQCSPDLTGCGTTGPAGISSLSADQDRWFPTISPTDNNRCILAGKDSDNSIFRAMLITDATPPVLSANSSGATFNAIRTADDARVATISAETLRLDMFWIDNNGALAYNRKTTTNVNTWATNGAQHFLVDNSGTSSSNYLKTPSVGLASDYNSGSKMVVVYGSTDATVTGGIHYATCLSSAPTGAADCPKTAYWSRTGIDPIIAAYATPPEPLPVVYTDNGNVVFDLVPVSTFTAPRLTTMSVTSGGLQAGLSGPPYYQIRLSGVNFRTLNGRRPSVSFIDATSSAAITGISVSSVTFVGYQDVIINMSIAVNVTGTRYSLRLTNPDGRVSNTLSSSFTVTAATITMLNPPSISYSSGIANIAGTSSKMPTYSPASLSTSQVKITIVSDPGTPANNGLTWDGSNFGSGGWINADLNATTPWSYTGWTNNATNQKDGVTYRVESRATSSDQGFGTAASQTYTVDKSGPVITVTSPLTNTFYNSNVDIIGGSSDAGIGVRKLTVLIANTNGTTDTSDDVYWNGSGWFSGSRYFHVSGSTLATAQGSFPWSVTALTTPAKPTWVDGTRYRVGVQADDDFGQQTTASERQFVYDISRPTATITTWANNLDWQKSMATIDGTIADNISDPANTRYVYLTLEQSGSFWDWQSNTWTGTPSAMVSTYSTTGNSWSFNTSGVSFSNGGTYVAHIWAVDTAGNRHGGVPGKRYP
jgi:hypothetical protein